MLAERFNIRKIIVWVVCLIIVLFAAIKIYSYLTTGKIIVTTNNTDNYIKIDRVTNGGATSYSKQSQGKLSLRVKPGKYNVTVYSQNVSHGSSRSVSVKARQTVHLSLNPPASLSPTPIYGSGTTGVAANKTDLYFIDTGSKKLMHANAAGFGAMFSNRDFINADWISPGVGVLQDTSNNLYYVSGNSIAPLALPFQISAGVPVAYSVSESGTIYVNKGTDIYSGRYGGAFTKIYSVNKGNLGLSAGIDRVAVIIGNNKSSVGTLVVVDDSGNITKKNIAASQATWSLDGKRLFVAGEGNNYILDSSLNVISSVPISKIGVSSWYDKNRIFYSAGSQLWIYDLKTSKANQVVSLPTGVGITAIYTDSDDSFVYFSAANSEKTQLYRVSLSGQSHDKSLDILGVLLPEEIGVCSLNYINFAHPTITIRYPSSGTLPDNCIKSAKRELQYYKLNPNGFTFITTPYTVNYHSSGE